MKLSITIRRWLPMLLLTPIFYCPGCQTASTEKTSPGTAWFLDEDIFTRTWTNQDGHLMQLMKSFVKQSRNCGEFLIVTFGDKESNKACYCEFYSIKHIPTTTNIDLSIETFPAKITPAYNVNRLLARMSPTHFVVGGIQMEDQTNKVVFHVDERANHLYLMSSDYSDPDKPKQIATPWNGGVICRIEITKNLQITSSENIYGGGPQFISKE